MFLQKIDSGSETGQQVEKSLTLADIGIKKISEKFANALWAPSIINSIARVNEKTINMVRETLGQTSLVGRELEQVIANATLETLEFGIGVEENLMMFKSLNEVFRVNTYLSQEQVVNMSLLAKNAGITSDEMGKLVERMK